MITGLEMPAVRTAWLIAAFIFLTGIVQCRAATITWTNTTGGDWNDPANWSPNQAPANGDDVIITNSGSYAITNASGVTLDNLTLGGTNGTQSLMISSLTLTNAGMVNSNGVLNWNGGDLEGALTVAQGGTLIQSNTLQFAYNNYAIGAANTAYLTNYGTVMWAGTIYGSGNASSHGGGGMIYNAGLWNAVADFSIAIYNSVGTNYFFNIGTLEKTGGVGTSTINWMFSNDGGTINTPGGAFSMGNWIGSGVVHGTATFSGGTITGTLASDCAVTASSTTVTGSMFISSNAIVTWNGGDVEGSLTVAQGGTLIQSNTLHFVYNNYSVGNTNTAYLTNYGTVIWAGTIDASANSSTHGGGGIIYNAGLWDAVADLSLGVYSGAGTNYFINTGTLEKTAATGTSTIGWNFSSSGFIETYSGTFNLNWGGPSVLHGNLTLNGTMAAPLTIASNAVLNLSSGDLESALTVAQGGTLIQSNTLHFAYDNYSVSSTNTGCLTNYGTVIWAGTIDASANSSTHGGGGIIYNAGLWDAVADLSMGVYSGSGTNYFINTGTLVKTAAIGTSTIGWTFDSEAGTLTTLSGYFTFSGTWSASSVVYGNATVSGPIAGIIASNGVITWLGGDMENSLTVAQGGTLVQSNTLHFVYNNYALGYTNTAYLTNYGTVIWAGTIDASANSSTHGGGGIIYNAGVWNAVADLSMGVYSGSGTNYFINTGTLEKTAGIGASTIGWTVENSGTLGSQTNTLSLTGNYDLTGGTLNSGINSLGNYGIIHLSGSPAALTGTLSANLNNGYVPATGSTFDVLTYSSESGVFTNFLPPFAVAMQTNYGATKLTLTVLNVRPLLNTIADQNLNELTTLGITATATDMDAGQSLTYALVSGPGDLNVSSAGATSWMPSEAQGPSTNLVVLQVTDNGTPPLSATNTFSVIVTEVNVAPVLTVPANTNINELATLTVTNTATDSDIPVNPLTFSLVSPLSGMAINATNGVFTWTPTEAQGPSTNTITVVVTDTNIFAVNAKSLTATNSFIVVVNEVNVAPVLGALSDTTVNPGQTVSFTATATDADIPTNTLTFSLVSPPGGATINSASGSFNWRPAVSQANTTNTVQVQVTDFNPYAVNSQHMSDTKSFKVVVNPLAPVVLTSKGFTNGQFRFQVSGTAGPDYIIAASTNLSVWSDIFTNLSPSMPFQFTNNVTFTNRFFRARLSP
jgi:hypothetical protein